MATEQRQHNNEATRLSGAPLNGALSPHSLAPAPARAKAGFSAIPFRHWRGRFTKLPVELQQIFLPLAEPHLPRIQKGEIPKCFLSCPQVGMLILELRDNEVWATYEDWWKVACQRLNFMRLHALSKRFGTFLRDENGGVWAWLPKQSILPPDLCLELHHADRQWSWVERSPPLWKQNDNLYRETDEAPLPLITNLWFDAAKPRAVRAPTRAALWRCVGGSRFHAA
jgi:hypothetical protein